MSNLTFSSLFEAMDLVRPKNPIYNAAVALPEVAERLREDIPFAINSGAFPFLEFRIYVKQDQIVKAWMFSDDKLMRDYLNGKISEFDLLNMIGSQVQCFD